MESTLSAAKSSTGTTTSQYNSKSNSESKNNLFHDKETFLSEASRKVAEASKDPIFKRGSCEQQKILRRVSVFDWNNMTDEWKSNQSIFLNDVEEEEDEAIINRYNQGFGMDSVDSLNDSFTNLMKIKYGICENKDPIGISSLHDHEIDRRCSRLFLVNIGDSLDSDNCNADHSTKRALVSVERISLLHDESHDNVIDSSSFTLKRLCSLDLDFPASKTISSISKNTEERWRIRQERQRTIKVDEVLWSKQESKCKAAPSVA